jgi:TPR repeat protein
MKNFVAVFLFCSISGLGFAQQPGYPFFGPTQPDQQYRKAIGLLALGLPTPREHDDALKMLRAAADKQYAPAQTALATVYERGSASDRDMHLALNWYEAAANQGDWIAQLSLGRIYYFGLSGVDRNTTTAKKWLQMAADSGSGAAAFYLGLLNDDGQDTTIDYTEAARWYLRAAAAGNPLAQEKLALILLTGKGVDTKRDTVSAYAWMLVSASFGNHDFDDQLESMELDLETSAADAARAKAIALRNEILQKQAGTGCNGWPGEFTGSPEPPPLSFQLICVN